MKQNLITVIYLLIFCTFAVKSYGPWKFYPYPAAVYHPYPRFPGCCTNINNWKNFAENFNIPDFSQFIYPNFNGNYRATKPTFIPSTTTAQPQIFNTFPAITDNPQTIRPPIPRKPTIAPVIVQPDRSPISRIGGEENNRIISTEDRIRAILQTTNAPPTQQSYFTYPEIKNSLNNREFQLGDIRPDGLHLYFPFGR